MIGTKYKESIECLLVALKMQHAQSLPTNSLAISSKAAGKTPVGPSLR